LHLYRYGIRISAITITQGVELGRPSELSAELEFDAMALQRIHVGG